jgi:hypothetical protein
VVHGNPILFGALCGGLHALNVHLVDQIHAPGLFGGFRAEPREVFELQTRRIACFLNSPRRPVCSLNQRPAAA